MPSIIDHTPPLLIPVSIPLPFSPTNNQTRQRLLPPIPIRLKTLFIRKRIAFVLVHLITLITPIVTAKLWLDNGEDFGLEEHHGEFLAVDGAGGFGGFERGQGEGLGLQLVGFGGEPGGEAGVAGQVPTGAGGDWGGGTVGVTTAGYLT